ncbi:hypothetical protein Hanom_Chr00s000688g01655051 [Helianthus anomalus]
MSIHSKDYPSNKLSNHRDHGCNFQKLGTIGVILQNHIDYLCILLLSFGFFYVFFLNYVIFF